MQKCCVWCFLCCPLSNILVCKNAFDAKMHLMPKCFLAVQKCIFASHFPKENVQLCKNAFDAKMHLMRCKNAFLHQMHLMQKCIFAYIFQRKMFSNAYILRSKMFSITFSKGKCSAKQNVRIFVFCKAKNTAFLHQQNVMLNIFQRKMFSTNKMLESGQHKKHQTQHFCTTKFSLQKCI